MLILNHTSFRRFRTFADAEAVAAEARNEDPYDTYEIVETKDGRFVVAIYDEDGHHIGNHP